MLRVNNVYSLWLFNQNFRYFRFRTIKYSVDSYNINVTVKECTIKSTKDTITLVLENKTEYKYFYEVNFELEV